MAVSTYGTLKHEGEHYEISAKPHVAIRLRRLFPRVQSTYGGSITLRDTPDVARDVEWALQRWPLDMDDATAEHIAARAQAHRDTEFAVQEILAGRRQRGDIMLEPARVPRGYQRAASDVVLETGALLIVHGVGLGKTFTSLLALREEDALPAAVVTLGGVLPRQWLHQLKLSFPDLVGHAVRTGPVYDPSEREGRQVDVIVMPYSRLFKWHEFLLGKVRTVIFDEVQELRHDGTNKYTGAMTLARRCDYVMGLTATPIYGYGGEIHTINEVINPGALGDRMEFLREWGGHQAGTGAHNQKLDEIGPLASFMCESGLMDVQTRSSVGMEMDEPERIVYDIDVDEQVLDKVAVDAAALAERVLQPGLKGIERMQVSSELDFLMRHATGVAKAPHVADLVTLLLEAEEKILLFGWHHDVYDIWADRLADFDPVRFTGKESEPQKRAAMESFLTGRSRVMMMSLRAGAGIDGLQDVCSVAVFGELDWAPGVHTQNIGRLARDYTDGRRKTELCVGYFCVSDQGSDPTMTDVLGVKTQQHDTFVDPTAPLTQSVAASDRIQRLAQAVLARRVPIGAS